MGHSGQIGGSLQRGCYPPTSWFQPQLILPLQSFPPSSLHCIPTTERKVHPYIRSWFWLAATLFWELLLEAHFQLTVLRPQSRTFAPFENGLSVHRHTEPYLHHTGGVKGVTMGQCKKGKMKQRRNNTRTAQREGGKWGGRHREKQNTRVHECRKL